MKLRDVATPALVLDRARMQANIERMADYAAGFAVPLRPHAKTPKCVPIVRAMLGRQARGITVSTLEEAEYFFAHGIDDIFYAVALAPAKVGRVAELIRKGASMTCLIDNVEAARAVVAAAAASGVIVPLIVEIDIDGYRCGVPIDSPDFICIARMLDDSGNTEFRGVMGYGGASKACQSPQQMRALAESFRQEMLRARGCLEAAGVRCEVLSFGSTAAVINASTMQGITELRCGIYVFQDLVQTALGACSVGEIALSVLSTVIGKQEHRNRIVIDAGGLALSKDRGTRGMSIDVGYGFVCDTQTGKLIDDLHVADVSQELGLVTTISGAPLDFDAFPIGATVRILPNHADMTAAAYEEYHVVEGDDDVKDIWSRTNRW